MQIKEVDIVEVEDYVELHNQPWYKEYVNGQYTERTQVSSTDDGA